jgi:hypothetical protein
MNSTACARRQSHEENRKAGNQEGKHREVDGHQVLDRPHVRSHPQVDYGSAKACKAVSPHFTMRGLCSRGLPLRCRETDGGFQTLEKRESFQTMKGDRSMDKSTKPAEKKSARKDEGKISVIGPEVFESTLIEKVLC